MLLSGSRYEEAVDSYNLIINPAKEGKLNEYYDRDKETPAALPV